MQQETLYQIALTLVPNIGPLHARLLIEKFETAGAVFKASRKDLEAVEGLGSRKATEILKFTDFKQAENELDFLARYDIVPLFITQPAYPQRLLHCFDAPTVLYYKGRADLNASRIVSVIGTRMNTDYGRTVTEKLTEELAPYNVTILSGLAFGIDAIAHKAALQHNLPTVAVIANGLQTIYPSQHKQLAKDLLANGGLLTEFCSGTKPDRHNFPRRNRIVAGMTDATIVVETALKGGSMITAELANSYNRDVFAFPGKTTDSKSSGCNYLIRHNKAILLTDAAQIAESLGWRAKKLPPVKQKEIFVHLSDDEQVIVGLLKDKESMPIDELGFSCNMHSSALAAAILNLELQGIIGMLPGKSYRLL
jgi:DNA processing protein